MSFTRFDSANPQGLNPKIPSQLVEQLFEDGHPSGLRLRQSGIEFLVSEDPSHSALRENFAGEFKAIAEHQIAHLEEDRLIAETRKAKARVPQRVLRFRKEVVFAPVMVPILVVGFVLLAVLGFGCNSEITTSIAMIIESPLFEMPHPTDPRLAALEPSKLVAVGFAFAPIFGFLLSLEFVFRVVKEPRDMTSKVLAFCSLLLSLACTITFAYVVGGGNAPGIEAGPLFESTTVPWQSLALNMVSLALMNAICIQLLYRLVLYCFEIGPAKTPLCSELNNELTRILRAIGITTGTLAILQAVIQKESLRRERKSLQAKLNSFEN